MQVSLYDTCEASFINFFLATFRCFCKPTWRKKISLCCCLGQRIALLAINYLLDIQWFIMLALEGHHKSSYTHSMSEIHFSYFWDHLGHCLGFNVWLYAVKLNDICLLPKYLFQNALNSGPNISRHYWLLQTLHCLGSLLQISFKWEINSSFLKKKHSLSSLQEATRTDSIHRFLVTFIVFMPLTPRKQKCFRNAS